MARCWWIPLVVVLAPGCRTPVATLPVNGTAVLQDGSAVPTEVLNRGLLLTQVPPGMVPFSRAAAATLRLRAFGHEPSWQADVHDDRIVIVTDRSAGEVAMPRTGTLADPPRTTYRAATDGRTLVVITERRSCIDTMSGDNLELAVTATLDGRTYRGCGHLAEGMKLDAPDPTRR